MQRKSPAGNTTDHKVSGPISDGTASRLLDAIRDRHLQRLGIGNLRDLLRYEPLQSARILAAVARGLIPAPPLGSLVRSDFAEKDACQAPSWPVSALLGVKKEETVILAAMGVATIADLAQLATEADQSILAGLEDNGFRERPSAPAQLLPGVTGSIASSVRFTTFIRDTELRKLTFRVNKDCAVALPVSPYEKQPGSLAELFEAQKCPVVHLGYMCDHRQRWINIGTHLGEVVHSLSLAPGESRNIALINWRRRQLTSLEERTTTNERLTATFVQNRAIEEITTAVAREHQSGRTQTEANTAVTAAGFVAAGAAVGGGAGAVIGTLVEPGLGTLVGAAVGAGAGVAAGGMVFAGSQALGMIEADTEGNREIIADVQQRISLSTSQAASAVRSLWSSVVVEDAQAEDVQASTSNITNYNHMHTLNIEYYEVLQHYLARIEVERVQPVVFLPFTFFDFTGFRFIRDYWEAVRVHVEDEGLRLQGDAYFVTEGPPEVPDLLPVPPMPTPPAGQQALVAKNLRIDVLFKSLPFNTNIGLDVLRGNQEISGTETENGVPGSDLDGYDWGNRYAFEDISDAQTITAVNLSRNQVLGMDVKYRVRVHKGTLASGGEDLEYLKGQIIAANKTIKGDDQNQTFTISWKPAAGFEMDAALAVAEYHQKKHERDAIVAENQRRMAAFAALTESIERFRERLQRLVLRRRHFFTRVILNAIEPEEINQLLEALQIGHVEAGNQNFGVPLSAFAHTIPLGMTAGGFVLKLKRLNKERLLRLAQSLRMDREVEEIMTLLQYADQTVSFFEDVSRKEAMARTDHVYVPTGGLFAEAILGRANGAEYLDMERYFNWQDSPIPHQAPTIQAVGTESRFQQGDVSVHVPEGNLQVINPVNLPEPSGLQGVLAAIQNTNLFRDMSKATELAGIIGNLTALAGQMGQAASTMTGQAAQQALQAATEVGKAAAGMAQTLMGEAFAQTGGAPANITSQGAALNKLREIDQGGAAVPGQGLPGGTAPVTGPPSGGGISSPTGEDIVRKAAGLPTRSGSARNRTLNVRLSFLSAYGVPIVYDVLAGLPKTFQLFHESDIRPFFDDTPGAAEAGMATMNKPIDPLYTFALSRWSATDAALAIEIDFGEGSFKGTVNPVDIPSSVTTMIVTAQIAAREQTVARAHSVSRTETLTELVQEKFGVSASVAKKIAGLADFGLSLTGETTDATTDTDSATGTDTTTVTEVVKVPTGGLIIDIKFRS